MAEDLLVVEQDESVLEHHVLLFRVGDEVGREKAAVELRALHHLELVGEPLAVLDRDHALAAHLLHRLGDHVAMEASLFAEIAPTWAISRRVEQGLAMRPSSATSASTA